MSAPARRAVAAALADAFRAGPWEPPAMAARARATVTGGKRAWLDQLARAVRSAYPEPPHDRPRELAAFVRHCPPFVATWTPDIRVRSWTPAPTAMGPVRWPVRSLATVGDLLSWLEVEPNELAWFADVRSLERDAGAEPLRHYRYTWIPKAGGGRLLEAPKPRLRAIQRRLLSEVLDPIHLHHAAHGFRRGRSVRTFAAPHVAQDVVVHLDLEAFFPSIGPGRVFGILRGAGYPEPVAHALTGLMTNAAPRHVVAAAVASSPSARGLLRRLSAPHLPQGAPTSPALANLAAFGLDRRLTALAQSVGATYTRYADDLAFSGGGAVAILDTAGKVIVDEGFRVHPNKTTVRRRHQRQQLTGVVVNQRLNVPRREYDALRALLHNAAATGPEGQNRERHPEFRSHVLGRISWVASVHPGRGAKLREAFDRVRW